MKLDIDSKSITLTCPGCSQKIDEQIGRLKKNPTLTCPGCGNAIAIKADELRQGIEAVEKSMDDLGRRLRNLFK